MANKSILSLRTGSPVGLLLGPVINPDNLKIEGWHVENGISHSAGVLLAQDIRDILPQGLVVDDQEALSDPKELIRLKPILDLNFELVGKHVVTENKKRLGKVIDFAFDKDSSFIGKIHVSQSLVKSFSGGELMIDRAQVIEVNNREIVVNEATVQEGSAVPAPALAQ